MQPAFVKISISLPSPTYSFLKTKSRKDGGVPVSQLIAAAVAKMQAKEKGLRK